MPNTIVIAGRILLVDDQPANLRVVTTLLKRQGYEVATATDGKSALEECHRFRPDLLVERVHAAAQPVGRYVPGQNGRDIVGGRSRKIVVERTNHRLLGLKIGHDVSPWCAWKR